MAKTRKLTKTVDYATGTVSLTVLSIGETLVCDTTKLSEEIKAKLIPLAISHRIGDAAAGRDGKEALESMSKVWTALVSGDFSVRASAAPGLTKKAIAEKLEGLSPKEKAAADALLAKLGISL